MSFPFVRRMTKKEREGRKTDWGRPIVNGTLAVVRYPTRLKASFDRGDPDAKPPVAMPTGGPRRYTPPLWAKPQTCECCEKGEGQYPIRLYERLGTWNQVQWVRTALLCGKCWLMFKDLERPKWKRLMEAVAQVFDLLLTEQEAKG